MGLDFWNNPIVVSAFRVKYRKGTLFRTTALYVLVLAMGGAVMEYYKDRFSGNWIHNYFLALMGLQFVVSALMASSSTATSVKNEVVSRTLDFQRIAALSPRQILIGKLFGEPALAYLLAIATVPLTFFCCLLGGVSLDVLLVLYLNLATTTLLFGAMGLGNRLEPPAGQADVTMIGFVGIFTPTPLVNAMRHDNPWNHSIPVFAYDIPWLLIVPLLQLVMAYLCFQTMERRLLNPLLPPYSKKLSYGLLILLDAIFAAGLVAPPPLLPVWTFQYRWTAFCLLHLTASLWLLTAVTPFKETLHDWVWRYRGRRPRLLDLWLDDRSANVLVLATFCLIGAVGLALGVLLPAGLGDGFAQVQAQAPQIVNALLLTSVLILALGTLHQRAVLLAGRSGAIAFFLVAVLFDLPVHIAGQYYRLDPLLALSPSAHFRRWFDAGPPLDVRPALLLYGLVLVATGTSLYWRLGRLERAVDAKLRQMGVLKPIATGGA